MKLGDRVTFARCHRLHRAALKAHVGQSGVITGKTTKGEVIVLLDDGVTIAVCPQWLRADELPAR